MMRTAPRVFLLFALLVLSACASDEPRRNGAHARWLDKAPRTVRVVIGESEVAPLYSIERHDVGKGALGGATAGLVFGSLIIGGAEGKCSRDCASAVAVLMGGGAVIGGVIGAVTAPGHTLRSFPVAEDETTRPLGPILQRTVQDITRRAAEMFAENLRRRGGHEVAVEEAGAAGGDAAESDITIILSSIELVGPGPGRSARASLRMVIQVRAHWRDSKHVQRFRYRSEIADLSDWAVPDSEPADQAARLAASNLAGRIFTALAEP